MTRYYENGLTKLVSYISTLSITSTYISGTINTLPYTNFVGLCSTQSTNLVISYEQGVSSGTLNTTSSYTVACANTPLSWNNYSGFGRFSISSVNSAAGDLVSFAVYGIGS